MVRKSPHGREFDPGLCHPATGKLSLSTQKKVGICSESGKYKAAEGVG